MTNASYAPAQRQKDAVVGEVQLWFAKCSLCNHMRPTHTWQRRCTPCRWSPARGGRWRRIARPHCKLAGRVGAQCLLATGALVRSNTGAGRWMEKGGQPQAGWQPRKLVTYVNRLPPGELANSMTFGLHPCLMGTNQAAPAAKGIPPVGRAELVDRLGRHHVGHTRLCSKTRNKRIELSGTSLKQCN